ncbi:hypothetical protein LTR91_022440 [Friedmanniomyces endolithicus]|uniref:Uncharacterized protein n=1 Tax=Friedmanniomyces endolithicus TaxID=329885 RepID=A0AAN6K482_9PEZI|nr:hypothetical protein LTR57_023059 [Friedmanniomyces endolithicus]KAK0954977.1 hypothetical protein LTS01_023621 [Friedmanniomyces endolithicus]KAK0956284.1 hypothetical protein LTR91_022440 [Friedmanniomyces endolithicus]KAK1024061.1 hypothetical protein LTS16_024372 [Friedmanniomyces endolithicus]
MAPLLSLRGALVGDNVEDCDRISTILLELYELKQERPSLFQKGLYTIKERAANKHARFQRMLDFQGPETGTMELLQAHKDECMSKPSAFWNYAPLLGPVGLELQARIVMCY